MNITAKHFVPIGIVIAAAYFGYRYYVVAIDPSLPVKDLLSLYTHADMVKARQVESTLLVKVQREPAKVVPELLKTLSLPHPDAKARELAITGLAATKDKHNGVIVAALLKSLGDSHLNVRVAACKAFREIRVEAAIEPLFDRLDDPSEDVKLSAHKTLKDLTRMSWPLKKEAWLDWWKEAKTKFYIRSDDY